MRPSKLSDLVNQGTVNRGFTVYVTIEPQFVACIKQLDEFYYVSNAMVMPCISMKYTIYFCLSM